MKSITKVLLVAVLIFSAFSFSVEGQDLSNLHVLAENAFCDYDQAPHLIGGVMWKYPQDAFDRDFSSLEYNPECIVFGDEVTFFFEGMNPSAEYVLDMAFFSDVDSRVQSILVDDTVLKEELRLAEKELFNLQLKVPQKTYGDGKIVLIIKSVQGPNACISRLKVLSNEPGPLSTVSSDYQKIMPKVLLSEPAVDSQGEPANQIGLNGVWKFGSVYDSKGTAEPILKDGNIFEIDVPGEWFMQGFNIPENMAAGYQRKFSVPGKWQGQSVKIRFDGVYSNASVWINGQKAGSHKGGFTPFELDITDLVKYGKSNTISLEVKSDSLSDELSSGSKYAVHPLGGISRKVRLFSVPKVNIGSYHIETQLDKKFKDAVIKAVVKVSNQSEREIKDAGLKFTLKKWPQLRSQKMQKSVFKLPVLKPGQTIKQVFEMPVDDPAKWNCESPELYVLQCRLSSGQGHYVIQKRFGFREVEIKGNRLIVNGRPVKLRGVNRHEAHPKMGRSLTADLWRQDAELFKEANCNFIRTSHYPPAQEFLDACDELGLFVEVEAPFCWVRNRSYSPVSTNGPDIVNDLISQQTLEMVERDRTHPSVLFWSLANESTWNKFFDNTYQLVSKVDPTRPIIFHNEEYEDQDIPALANDHYPGPQRIEEHEDFERPMLYGEFCHLNAYNRYEIMTDPGLRDIWGKYFAQMWERMYATDAILGGALWSGVDDTFFPPAGGVIGYGTWGPIDGWRRKKPEYWHMKKAFSPVRVITNSIDKQGPFVIELENRFDFTNLKDCEIAWQSGNEKGDLTADIEPGATGTISVPVKEAGDELIIVFKDPQGYLVEQDVIGVGKKNPELPAKQINASALKIDESESRIIVKNKSFEMSLDKATGEINHLTIEGEQVITGGPHLMILPLNDKGEVQMQGSETAEFYSPTCQGWELESFSYEKAADKVVIQTAGAYEKAKGSYEFTITAAGEIAVDYNFESAEKVKPRQIGLVFDFPQDYQSLSWHRKGLWNNYPQDHIGRLKGQANAFSCAVKDKTTGPRIEPQWSWSQDSTDYGTNDFRSTKANIYWAALSKPQSQEFLAIKSDATQSIRAWMGENNIHLLVADYINAGTEEYFRPHSSQGYIEINEGDSVKGKVPIIVLDNDSDQGLSK